MKYLILENVGGIFDELIAAMYLSYSALNLVCVIRSIRIFPNTAERKNKNQVDLTLDTNMTDKIFYRRLGANAGPIGTFWKTESGDFRPRTTGDKGQWSGIRYYYNMNYIINTQFVIINCDRIQF